MALIGWLFDCSIVREPDLLNFRQHFALKVPFTVVLGTKIYLFYHLDTITINFPLVIFPFLQFSKRFPNYISVFRLGKVASPTFCAPTVQPGYFVWLLPHIRCISMNGKHLRLVYDIPCCRLRLKLYPRWSLKWPPYGSDIKDDDSSFLWRWLRKLSRVG